MPPDEKLRHVLVLSDSDKNVIARALHEAAWQHFDTSNYSSERDAATGRTMMAALNCWFPEEAEALADADNLRKALSLGFLPPPGGTTHQSVRNFLIQYDFKARVLAP